MSAHLAGYEVAECTQMSGTFEEVSVTVDGHFFPGRHDGAVSGNYSQLVGRAEWGR